MCAPGHLVITFEPFVWKSEPPADSPFRSSPEFRGLRFLGRSSDYHVADTWYPSWASDGRLYSPFTDGSCPRLDGSWERSDSNMGARSTTGQVIAEGDDPLNLKIYSLGLTVGDPTPYAGRYPCGSLVHDGVWYYGTYCLGPAASTPYGGVLYNWPWMGPFVGFRISSDYGRTWTDTPHTPEKPIFGEDGRYGHPLKIGSPHFVDFGKNMEHSQDGKAYLVAHGSEPHDGPRRFGHLSWITGDQIYLLRVTPGRESINDPSQYEFYAGRDSDGAPVWSNDFAKIRPLIDWPNNCGCVTVTYNAPLKKFLMCVTDGWPTAGTMRSYILEADALEGPWRMVTYLKDLGQQAYFLNFPSKFIGPDGRKLWLCYSGNYAKNWNGQKILENPPGSHYGLVLQEVELI